MRILFIFVIFTVLLNSLLIQASEIIYAYGRCKDLFLKETLFLNNRHIYLGSNYFGYLDPDQKTIWLPDELVDRLKISSIEIDKIELPHVFGSNKPLFRIQINNLPFYNIQKNDKYKWYNSSKGTLMEVRVVSLLSDFHVLIDLGNDYKIKNDFQNRYISVQVGDLSNGTDFLWKSVQINPANIKLNSKIVRAARLYMEERVRDVKGREHVWVFDGQDSFPIYSTAESYDNFSSGLGNKSISQYAKERKESGFSSHVLDLFGSARFTKYNESFDSLTGARLEPKYNKGTVEFPYPKWDEVTGDFLLNSTWKKLRDNMEQRNIPSFDLIFFQPIGASELFYSGTFNPYANIYSAKLLFRLFHQAYNLLNKNGGVLLISIDSFDITKASANNPTVQAFFSFLKNHNISYETTSNEILKISRSPNDSKI